MLAGIEVGKGLWTPSYPIVADRGKGRHEVIIVKGGIPQIIEDDCPNLWNS